MKIHLSQLWKVEFPWVCFVLFYFPSLGFWFLYICVYKTDTLVQWSLEFLCSLQNSFWKSLGNVRDWVSKCQQILHLGRIWFLLPGCCLFVASTRENGHCSHMAKGIWAQKSLPCFLQTFYKATDCIHKYGRWLPAEGFTL